MAVSLHLQAGTEPYPGFKLVQFLGRGGWGEVWKSVRTADQMPFAIKFLPGESQREASQEIRALQSIKQLSHANLLAIEQIWVCPGYLAIVMELAEGNLLDLLEVYYAEFNIPIPPDHLCFFLSQAAAAIDFLNARQHVADGQRVAFRHCDVKPSNLLIRGKTVKLGDFSLAVQSTASMGSHRQVGTLDYAGPEIFHGCLSDRSDQYALAVSYYQLRTGRLPFSDTPSDFDTSYVRPVPDLSDVAEAERSILVRALDPVPQARWPSCAEMMNRLTDTMLSPLSPARERPHHCRV